MGPSILGVAWAWGVMCWGRRGQLKYHPHGSIRGHQRVHGPKARQATAKAGHAWGTNICGVWASSGRAWGGSVSAHRSGGRGRAREARRSSRRRWERSNAASLPRFSHTHEPRPQTRTHTRRARTHAHAPTPGTGAARTNQEGAPRQAGECIAVSFGRCIFPPGPAKALPLYPHVVPNPALSARPPGLSPPPLPPCFKAVAGLVVGTGGGCDWSGGRIPIPPSPFRTVAYPPHPPQHPNTQARRPGPRARGERRADCTLPSCFSCYARRPGGLAWSGKVYRHPSRTHLLTYPDHHHNPPHPTRHQQPPCRAPASAAAAARGSK